MVVRCLDQMTNEDVFEVDGKECIIDEGTGNEELTCVDPSTGKVEDVSADDVDIDLEQV